MKRPTDAEVLLRLLGEECDCCCECEHDQQTAADREAPPARPQMLGKKMPPLTVVDTDQPFVPSYPSFDSPQRAASLGLPHVPLLLDPDPASDKGHEARFAELSVTGQTSSRTMVRDSGEISLTGSLGGPLLIDQVARAVYPGPRATATLIPVTAVTGVTIRPVRSGTPGYGATTDQPTAGYPETGGQEVPLTDTSGNHTAPYGVLPRFDLLETRTALFRRTWAVGLAFAGGVLDPPEPDADYDCGQRLLAQVGVTVHLRDNDPQTQAVRDRTLTSRRFRQQWAGHVVTLQDNTQAFSTGQPARIQAEGIGVLAAYGFDGATFQPQPLNDVPRYLVAITPGSTVIGTSDGVQDTQLLVGAYGDLWVQVFSDALQVGDAEYFRRHFRSAGIEVWGDARVCSGLASGDVQDLTGGAELRMNGRVYTGGSWAALRVGQKTWVLHLGGVLTREVLGGSAPPATCTLAELMALCRRPDLTPLRLKTGVLHTNWPHDRAALETRSGPTLHLTDWQPWRDTTRQEWGSAKASRPKRADLITSQTKLPPTPPLGLALADAATTGQWDAVPRNGSPHLLPTKVETYSQANGWQVSASGLKALAKPLLYPGVTPLLDDRTSVGGRLRVTFPAAPWAVAQRRLVLSARTRTPIKAVTVGGLSVTPLVLGREVQVKASKLLPPRGWHPVAITVPVSYDPTQVLVLELDTHAARLSRLLLSLVGPESGGTDT